MTQRTFIYNDVTFPDPGAQYTNEQVRQFLASQYFSELNRCEVQVGEEQDGNVEVRFVKRVTTKATAPLLLQALQEMPCEETTPDPTYDIIARFGDAPTIATVLEPQHAEWIDAYITHLEYRQIQIPDGQRTLKWSQQLPARSVQIVPSGF